MTARTATKSSDFAVQVSSKGLGYNTPQKAGRKLWLETITTAFPDLHSTIEDIFTDGEKVATRVTARMTHNSEFMGVAPTGKLIESSAVALDRVVNGQIVEKWEMRDLQSVLARLGA